MIDLWYVMVDDAEMGSGMDYIKQKQKKDNTWRACPRLMIAALLQEVKKREEKRKQDVSAHYALGEEDPGGILLRGFLVLQHGILSSIFQKY